MNQLTSLGIVIGFGISLSACSLAPNYQRPDAPIPSEWPSYEVDENINTNSESAEITWRQFFLDPALRDFINVALENNRDLRLAMLNVEAFRAQYRIRRSEQLPSIGADANVIRERMANPLLSNETSTSTQYDLSVGISAYELDFFGRVRNLSESALQSYLATEEAQRTIAISLISEVAMAYMNWQTDQAQLKLAESTMKAYKESLLLLEASAEVGIASELDVTQARTLVQQAQSEVSRYTRQVAQDKNGLALLLGTALPEVASEDRALDMNTIAGISAGLPSDLLEQRPDIRAAERKLMAANADIGAARAAFFPSISLTASAGSISDELSGLFDSNSDTWRFMPQIRLPIFTAGRLQASLDYAELRRDSRIAEYEKSIQIGFREVADGLAARATYGEQLAAQKGLVKTTEEYYQLAQQRYNEGVASYLTVLDARRSLFNTQQQLLLTQLGQLTSEVLLYKALGGGLG